jgi:hypothetical protein
MRPTIKMTVASNPAVDLTMSLKNLTRQDVLVGVPEATAPRKRGAANNALIAYVQDQGSPRMGIPAREFMRPGILNAKEEITKRFEDAGKAALEGRKEDIAKNFVAAGLIAQKSIRRKIQTGPFAPLKPATIKARKRRHKGRSNTSVTPLIDTGQLLQSINFVIRNK